MATYKTVEVKEINDKYITKETVNGGYINRGSYAYYTYTITWSKDLKIVNFLFDDKDLTDVAINGIKAASYTKMLDYEYRKMKPAISRHLKALRINLGLIEKPKEKKAIKVIYEEWTYRLSKLNIQEVTNISDKRLTNGSYYTSQFNAVDWTPELEIIALEYNIKLAEFENYRNEVKKKLFDGKKYNKLK